MRIKRMLSTLLLLTLMLVVLMAMTAPSAFACHKGKAHGQQTTVTVEPVQDEAIVCGSIRVDKIL